MKNEIILSKLFDYQLFLQNPELNEVITKTVKEYEQFSELSEDQLDIWAAGDPDSAFFTDFPETEDD